MRHMASKKHKDYPYTKEELTEFLLKKRDELGRKPTKKDIPEEMRSYYRVYFKKWCYALEECGIVIPSERTLARRMRHKSHDRRLREKQAVQDGEQATTTEK